TVYGAEGEVIEGDEKEIDKVTDIWTFSRAANGRDPNWKLIATESES
ncbi:MAG: TIM44-like domain-containing protein, partial [Rhizobiales bacterium]|nr:TIM44-like domain-containing protein [Hyphomicrobiales bacterium]